MCCSCRYLHPRISLPSSQTISSWAHPARRDGCVFMLCAAAGRRRERRHSLTGVRRWTVTVPIKQGFLRVTRQHSTVPKILKFTGSKTGYAGISTDVKVTAFPLHWTHPETNQRVLRKYHITHLLLRLPIVFPAAVAGKIPCKKDLILLGRARRGRAQSAVPPKADMCAALVHVCFGP